MPDLSILIVNYRCWEKLANCLKSLLNPSDLIALEVIVVDNDSADGKLEAFSQRFPAVKFVANGGNYGFASGCNLAASHATAPNLLFLNPDTLAEPEALSALLKIKHDNPSVALLSCRQLDEKGRNQRAFGMFPTFWTHLGFSRAIVQKLFPQRYPSPRKEHHQLVFCDWISGSVVMVSRIHFDALGGWDESFWMYSEDADISKRALNSGLKVAYEPSVSITHLHGGASRGSIETKALTKSEVIISKHHLTSKHSPNPMSRAASHTMIILSRTTPILIAGLLTALGAAFGKRTTAFRKSQHLLSYYHLWLKTKDSRSPRAKTR